jgi:hypothetical protein
VTLGTPMYSVEAEERREMDVSLLKEICGWDIQGFGDGWRWGD